MSDYTHRQMELTEYSRPVSELCDLSANADLHELARILVTVTVVANSIVTGIDAVTLATQLAQRRH